MTAHQNSAPTCEPNWVGLAREYGAMSTYRQVHHPATADCYYYSNTNRTYQELVVSDGPVLFWPMHLQGGAGAGRYWPDAGTNAINSDTDDDGPDSTITGPVYGVTDVAPYNSQGIGGSDWQAETSNSAVACTFPFTMECWFSTDVARNDKQLLLLSGQTDYRIVTNTSNKCRPTIMLEGAVSCGLEAQANCTSTEPNRSFTNIKYHDGTQDGGSASGYFNDEAWHHVVVVITSSTATMYLDGQKYSVVGSHTGIAPSASSSTPALKVADSDAVAEGYGGYKGHVSNVSLYDHALTTDQIVRHYNAGAKHDRMKFGSAGGSGGYASGGVLAPANWGDNRPGPKVRWGDPHAQTMVMAPSAYDATETLEAGGDKFARPEKQLQRESAGGFALVCSVIPTINTASEDKMRTIYDSRMSGSTTSCTSSVTDDTWGSGVMVGIDEDGFPVCKWRTDGSGITYSEKTQTATSGAIADGEFAWLSCVITVDPSSANQTSVYLMKNYEIVASATSQNDLCKDPNRVPLPAIGFPVGSDSGPASENWQGELGPLMLFYNNDMTTSSVAQLIKAAEGSDWTSRTRKNPHRITRPQRYYSSGRV